MALKWSWIHWDQLSPDDKFILLVFPVSTAFSDRHARQFAKMSWAVLPADVKAHLVSLRWHDILTAAHPNPTGRAASENR